MGTSLSEESSASLGVSAAKGVLTKTGINLNLIDEVIFGCVGQHASEMNLSRIIGVRAGVPQHIPAVTVHRNCASGLEAVTYAAEKAAQGKGDIFLVGGTENMSQMPLLFPFATAKKFGNLFKSKSISQKFKALTKFRPSDFTPQISLKMGLEDPLSGINMGQTAELLARELEIPRIEQDNFAALSHVRALNAKERGDFNAEITPFYSTNNDCIRTHSGAVVLEDNGPRIDASITKLSSLKPVFDKREGMVTAGNASQITDGAVALLVMTEEGLNKTGLNPMAKIVDYSHVGCDPARMGLGPVAAINKLQINIKSMDLIEINEAFAAQVLACKKLLEKTHCELPYEKLNTNGGSIALGHPVGASGARLVLTLAKQLQQKELTHGVAALCVGGGQGSAIHLEACK